jgi:hypothetical protein
MMVIHTEADDSEDDLFAGGCARGDGRDSIFNDGAKTRLVTEDQAVRPAIDQKHQIDLMTFHG